jgi:RimJ/RimL family protein N-acetyltransferase
MFILDKFKPEDAEDLCQILQDQWIHKCTLVIPNPYTLDDANWYINRTLEKHKEWEAQGKEPLQFCMRSTETGKVIGNIGIDYEENPCKAPTGELGYYLDSQYRGKGLMSKAVEQIVANAWTWDIVRIEAGIFSFNNASGRVLEKSGFTFEGTLRSRYKKSGGFVDCKMYALVRQNNSELNF